MDKSEQAEEVEEGVARGFIRFGGRRAGGWVTGKSGKRGIPVPELGSDGKSECSRCSVSKQPSAAVICANISRDYGSGASWERLKRRCEDRKPPCRDVSENASAETQYSNDPNLPGEI